MSIKLIALDIDDTLLNSKGKITEATKQALDKALDQGIKVVLCSGRPLAGVTPYLKNWVFLEMTNM
jgi:Predicted hydrolases of the HAD superfamily